MGGAGELLGKTVDELASLPNTSDVGARYAFLVEFECAQLAPNIDMTGSAVAFFQRLLCELSGRDDTAVPDFLQRVARSRSIGVDRAQAFIDLSQELLALDPVARRSLFAPNDQVAQLPAEFQAATRRGIAELGSKYIPNLYFRRDEIENRFDEFLDSNVTCFLIVSKPGRGKTNFLCNIAQRLRDEWNILFLTARAPLAGPSGILELISSWLGYEADWSRCFSDMKRLRQPCLILLDAINESAAPPEVLKEALNYLLREAERVGLKVVVTCRTDFWQFYRGAFWASYVWTGAGGGAELARSSARGQDLPLFTPEQFDEIVTAYFRTFQVDGELAGEAADRCRHPLMLRIFCEAYAARSVGVVTELRLYRLLREFWARKIEHVAEVWNLRQTDAVARLVLTVAGLMRQRRSTSVPRDEVAKALAATPTELDSSTSLYSRVLDEEIVLEENVDEDAGIRNVIFVYDRFSEYAIALSFYTTEQWYSKPAEQILIDTDQLMTQEQSFGTLRGSLEFLVQRLEDRRPAEKIQFAILRRMVEVNLRWANIGTSLTFQLDPELSGPAFWVFVRELTYSDKGFVRRMVAEHVGLQVSRDSEQVLAVLNMLREDPLTSVRNSAIQAILGLPVQVVVKEIEDLVSVFQDQFMAAKFLLWPRDWTSLVLRRKLEWLVGSGHAVISEQVILNVLQAETPDNLDDLFGQEELATAMSELRLQYIKNQPNSREVAEAARWETKMRAICDRSVAILENDLAVLERTFVLTDMALRRAMSAGVVATPLSPLRELFPARDTRDRFIGQFAELVGFDSPKSLRGSSCLELAAEVARSEPYPHLEAGLRFSGESGYFGRALDDADVTRLRNIIKDVCERTEKAQGWKSSTFGLSTSLSLGELARRRGAVLEFQQDVLEKYGIIASPENLRRLTTVGRMVLWIDDRLQQQRRHESLLLRLREEIKALDFHKLRDRLGAYQRLLSKDEQTELGNELLILARIYKDRPAQIAELLAPLIIWHDSQGSELLDEVLDEIHSRDATAFWPLAQALLNYSDQRVIDLASAAIERAENAERQAPESISILAGIAEIVEEIAGVPADEVRMESSFVDDLDIDSLSMVEIVIAAQDKFGVEIPDDRLRNLTTVRDVVEFMQNNERSLSSGR